MINSNITKLGIVLFLIFALKINAKDMKLNDLTGRKFGKLTIVDRALNKGRRTQWWAVCDCGSNKSRKGPQNH